MITLPEFARAFDHENNFYLSCDSTRIGKVLAHYELYKKVRDLPGEIVECGVFKGASFVRFAMFRELFGNPFSKKLIGFDAFGKFPETGYRDDVAVRQRFVSAAGEDSISREQLLDVLRHKGITQGIELVEGDITTTVPTYLRAHPELKISLLNVDTDIYEPAVTILEQLYPRIVTGGVLVLDDYGVFPGETKATDDHFKDKPVRIRRFPFARTPCYAIKDE